MNKRVLVILISGFLLTACGSIGFPAPQNGPMGYGYNNNPGAGQFTSNGQQIYFTATDQNGQSISYAGGPAFGGMMMGASLACVSCHGPQGRGGTSYMHMQSIDAPSIYYDALVEMRQEDSGGTPQPGGYTLDDFRGEVIEGHDIDGSQLDGDMPRWQMSETDLADLFQFLKTLP